MFSRIRNHEKLVENGENPSIVARKLKEGTHEKDSDPFRILGGNSNSRKSVLRAEFVEMTENPMTEIMDKGEGEIEMIGKRGGREDCAITELIMKDPIDAQEDRNSLSFKKNKRPKNGSVDLEINLSEVQDLHSYKEPSSKSQKGKKILKEVVSEVVHYDGETFA